MPNPFGWLFSQHFDYFRLYKSQVDPGLKDHPIEFMVDFFRPFGIIWDNWRAFKTILKILGQFFYPLGPFRTFWDYIWPFWTMFNHCG